MCGSCVMCCIINAKLFAKEITALVNLPKEMKCVIIISPQNEQLLCKWMRHRCVVDFVSVCVFVHEREKR